MTIRRLLYGRVYRFAFLLRPLRSFAVCFAWRFRQIRYPVVFILFEFIEQLILVYDETFCVIVCCLCVQAVAVK